MEKMWQKGGIFPPERGNLTGIGQVESGLKIYVSIDIFYQTFKYKLQ